VARWQGAQEGGAVLAMYCQSTVDAGPTADGQHQRASAAAPWGNRSAALPCSGQRACYHALGVLRQGRALGWHQLSRASSTHPRSPWFSFNPGRGGLACGATRSVGSCKEGYAGMWAVRVASRGPLGGPEGTVDRIRTGLTLHTG
jgi:hypothetical protein